jgi:hypothetical protein
MLFMATLSICMANGTSLRGANNSFRHLQRDNDGAESGLPSDLKTVFFVSAVILAVGCCCCCLIDTTECAHGNSPSPRPRRKQRKRKQRQRSRAHEGRTHRPSSWTIAFRSRGDKLWFPTKESLTQHLNATNGRVPGFGRVSNTPAQVAHASDVVTL